MMKNDRWFVPGIVLLFLVITGGIAETQVEPIPSVNIVGFSAYGSVTITARGEVVTIGGMNSTFELSGTGLSVLLECKDTTFSGEVSSKTIAGLTILPNWVRAMGTVERISIEGQDLALEGNAIQNGCLATKQYGEVPVYFHYAGEFPNPSKTNVCILVFGVEQARALGQSLRENKDRESRPPKPADGVPAMNQVPEERQGTSRQQDTAGEE